MNHHHTDTSCDTSGKSSFDDMPEEEMWGFGYIWTDCSDSGLANPSYWREADCKESGESSNARGMSNC